MRKSGWLSFVLVIVINLIISSCALSFESKETDRSTVNPNYPEKIEQPDLVDVQFNVFTSTKFSDEDLLSLDILDLVSGFQYNVERYSIPHDLNNNFVISVPLPEGATISYRYSMLQPLQVNEALPGGDHPDRRGQGRRLGSRGPRPRPAQRPDLGEPVRLRDGLPARAVPPVPTAVLRGRRRGLGGPQRRDGLDRRVGTVPLPAGRPGDRGPH